MGAKKDPAKFTIRFNLADPQQMEAAGLLERQGRCKAQFITSAILHYINCLQTPELHTVSTIDTAQIECIVWDVLAQQQSEPQRKPAADILIK